MVVVAANLRRATTPACPVLPLLLLRSNLRRQTANPFADLKNITAPDEHRFFVPRRFRDRNGTAKEKETRFGEQFSSATWLAAATSSFLHLWPLLVVVVVAVVLSDDELHFFFSSVPSQSSSSLPFFFSSPFQQPCFLLLIPQPAQIGFETQISRTRTHPGGTRKPESE